MGNADEQLKQRSSPSMISSASVFATERSKAPAHDGQMRYASRLFFKQSHYSNATKKHKRDKWIEVNFCGFSWLVTLAAVVSGDHAEAILILGGVEEIANEGACGFGIAKGFGLQRVDPRVVPCIIRTASQVSEILE